MRPQLFLTALALCSAVFAQDLRLDLDPAHTTIRFTLPATLHTVHGSFKLKHGTVHFDPATGKISGEVAVDATSGDSGDEGRDRKMHKEILESQRYPEITFAPDRIEGAVAREGPSQVRVHGMFRVHGATHEIVIPLEVRITGGHIAASAHFAIPYIAWGMKNPSTFVLRVKDSVEIDVTVE